MVCAPTLARAVVVRLPVMSHTPLICSSSVGPLGYCLPRLDHGSDAIAVASPTTMMHPQLFDQSGMVEVVSWSPSGELTRVSCSPAEALLIEDSQPPEDSQHPGVPEAQIIEESQLPGAPEDRQLSKDKVWLGPLGDPPGEAF